MQTAMFADGCIGRDTELYKRIVILILTAMGISALMLIPAVQQFVLAMHPTTQVLICVFFVSLALGYSVECRNSNRLKRSIRFVAQSRLMMCRN